MLADLFGDLLAGPLVAGDLDAPAGQQGRVEKGCGRDDADVTHGDHLQRDVAGHREPQHELLVRAGSEGTAEIFHEERGPDE